MAMLSQQAVLNTLDVVDLVRDCVAHDGAIRDQARRLFQSEYGAKVYNFPVKICRLSEEEAGDFYLYAFDTGRIFQRLRTFTGCQQIHFRTFLSYYVLKTLFFEWLRTRRDLELVSLDTPLNECSGEKTATLQDTLSTDCSQPDQEASERVTLARRILCTLRPQERLLLKLLSLAECDLEPEELRVLSDLGGYSIDEAMTAIAQVRENLVHKDERLSRLQAELDSTWGWILLRQRELQKIREEIPLMQEQSNTGVRAALRARQKELEAVIAKRVKQRRGILEQMKAFKLTTPYADIARILKWPIGTLSARVTRLRERLARDFGCEWNQADTKS
jgi:hypothetical protein